MGDALQAFVRPGLLLPLEPLSGKLLAEVLGLRAHACLFLLCGLGEGGCSVALWSAACRRCVWGEGATRSRPCGASLPASACSRYKVPPGSES